MIVLELFPNGVIVGGGVVDTLIACVIWVFIYYGISKLNEREDSGPLILR